MEATSVRSKAQCNIYVSRKQQVEFTIVEVRVYYKPFQWVPLWNNSLSEGYLRILGCILLLVRRRICRDARWSLRRMVKCTSEKDEGYLRDRWHDWISLSEKDVAGGMYSNVRAKQLHA